MEKITVFSFVGLSAAVSLWFAYASLTQPGLLVGTYATVSVTVMVGALLALKAYEVWRK